MAFQSTSVSDRELIAQLAPQDLDEAIAQLTTAVSTSGRERAAHTLLDAHVHASREQAWREREASRPPRPLPDEHRRHLRDLDQARAELGRARAVAQRLTTHVHDLENQREALPIWARGRRRDLTAEIETTRDDWLHQHANDQVDRAGRAVETAKGVVEVDSVQRVADDRAGRQYRHQLWLERSLRPYVYPSPGITQVEALEQGSPPRAARDQYRAVQPPSQGYGRSL